MQNPLSFTVNSRTDDKHLSTDAAWIDSSGPDARGPDGGTIGTPFSHSPRWHKRGQQDDTKDWDHTNVSWDINPAPSEGGNPTHSDAPPRRRFLRWRIWIKHECRQPWFIRGRGLFLVTLYRTGCRTDTAATAAKNQSWRCRYTPWWGSDGWFTTTTYRLHMYIVNQMCWVERLVAVFSGRASLERPATHSTSRHVYMEEPLAKKTLNFL